MQIANSDLKCLKRMKETLRRRIASVATKAMVKLI
jgi:hypothetical protein